MGTDQDKRFVLVVDNANKTAYREVKLGAQQDGLQVINSGLSDGDRIVVNGLQRVQPGDAVTPKVVPMPTGSASAAITAEATPATPDTSKKSATKESSKG